jgi:hypothetical protein
MNKQQAGSKGGKTTFQKYGRNHMQDIGARGAMTTWTRYVKVPYGQTQYALVDRLTGKTIRILDQ